MYLNHVEYQVWGFVGLAPDGSPNAALRARAGQLALAHKAVEELKLQKYAIMCTVTVESTLPIPGQADKSDLLTGAASVPIIGKKN